MSCLITIIIILIFVYFIYTINQKNQVKRLKGDQTFYGTMIEIFALLCVLFTRPFYYLYKILV